MGEAAARPGTGRTRASRAWQIAPHGARWRFDPPAPPDGVGAEALAAWQAWFESAWWGHFWELADVPMLELVLVAFDAASRDVSKVPRLADLLDKYGCTPMGRYRLRWCVAGDAVAAEVDGDDEVAERRRARDRELR